MTWGITPPTLVGIHWFRESGIACGDAGRSTFALGAVSCPACREVLDAELERITRTLAPPGVPSEFDLSDV